MRPASASAPAPRHLFSTTLIPPDVLLAGLLVARPPSYRMHPSIQPSLHLSPHAGSAVAGGSVLTSGTWWMLRRRSPCPRFRTRQPGRIFATPRCPLPAKLLAKHAYLRVLGPSSKSGGLHAHGSARGLYPPGPEARKRRGGGRRVERVSGTGRSQAPSALRATLSLRLCAWPRFPPRQLHGGAKSLKGQPVPGGVGGREGKRG